MNEEFTIKLSDVDSASVTAKLCEIHSKVNNLGKKDFENSIALYAQELEESKPNYIDLAASINTALYKYLYFLERTGCDGISKPLIENFIKAHTKIFSGSLGKKNLTLERNTALAYLVAGLNGYGASIEQSKKAVSIWAGKTFHLVEKAYKQHRPKKLDFNKCHIEDIPEELFSTMFMGRILPLDKHIKNKHPKRKFPTFNPVKGNICPSLAYKKLIERLHDNMDKGTVVLAIKPLHTDYEGTIWEK